MILKALKLLFPEGVKKGVARDFRTLAVILCALGSMALYGKTYVDGKNQATIIKIKEHKEADKELQRVREQGLASVIKGYHATIITKLKAIESTQADLKSSQTRVENRVWNLSRQVKPN